MLKEWNMGMIEQNKETNQLGWIDFLKFIGISGIIVAHVGAPKWAIQARNFDVILLVFLSAFLSSTTFRKLIDNSKRPIEFVLSRIKRLVIPVWAFLTFFFLFKAVAQKELFDIGYYLKSYGLTLYGIGYVWVILIYVYIALLIPLFDKLGLNVKSIVGVFIIYFLYEVLYFFNILSNPIVYSFFCFIIPYGVVGFLGFYYNKLNRKKRIELIAGCFTVFASLAITLYARTGTVVYVQMYKYPPRLYYVSFGLFMTLMLAELCRLFSETCICKNIIIRFVSRKSMQIYLWHIFSIELYEMWKLPQKWYLKYIVVYLFAIVLTVISDALIKFLKKKRFAKTV